MLGLVLAAGAGRRLQPLTDDLPKALLPVLGEMSVLELTLRNFASSGIEHVVAVTGFAEHRIQALVPELQERCGVSLELVHNDRALVWNNAYSLWCARHFFGEGLLLCNGDTVHPQVVEQRVLSQRGPDLLLALDTEKVLGEEEMKVTLDQAGTMSRITKLMDPARADGEYIGMTVIEPAIATELADALRTTFERDPQLYYEDGYQELADRGVPVNVAPIGAVQWVEVDDHRDLARAREITAGF
jgi:choline kinase